MYFLIVSIDLLLYIGWGAGQGTQVTFCGVVHGMTFKYSSSLQLISSDSERVADSAHRATLGRWLLLPLMAGLCPALPFPTRLIRQPAPICSFPSEFSPALLSGISVSQALLLDNISLFYPPPPYFM